ncbi:MAG: hypothetical protein AAGI11_12485 [Pseudomonadota bacterium]
MDCYYSTLPGETLVEISGPDTLTFLQGQTSCDTRELDGSRALTGVYCTPQGRTVCDFLLLELGEHHCGLRLRADIADTSAQVLGKYIIFSKADIHPAPSPWQVAACWGEGARDAVTAVMGTAPGERLGACRSGNMLAVQVDDAGEAFELFYEGDPPSIAAQHGEEEAWRSLAIARGEARIEAATSGELIPQVLNYDLTGHISFTKGCYTGQEVVARLHYRGKTKRRAFIAQCPTDAAAVVGMPLFTAGREQASGEVINIATPGAGPTHLLVSAVVEAPESGLRLGAPDGPALQLTPPPYPLD